MVVKADKTEIMVSRVLKTFEEELAGQRNFIRIHKSYIANLDYMRFIGNTESGMLTFVNGVSIPTTNLAEIKERLKEL